MVPGEAQPPLAVGQAVRSPSRLSGNNGEAGRQRSLKLVLAAPLGRLSLSFVIPDGSYGCRMQPLGCGVFRVETRHSRIKNIASDRLYLVLEGQGRFTVAGESFEVTQGDVVLVSCNTPYN